MSGVAAAPPPPPLPYRGLGEAEAAARLLAAGPNELPRGRRRTAVRILLGVLGEPMFALLLAAAAMYLTLGDLIEASILCLFATTSVAIALIQEARTERVLESLRDLTSPRALVIRGGVERRIAGRDVVRGDLVAITEGDRVPADAILLSGQDLQLDEAILTGEAVPVRKKIGAAPPAMARPGGDDLPCVYSGSLVVRGYGLAEVTATGARSEIGRIGLSLGQIDPEPPRLRAQTRRLVTRFATISLSLAALATVFYGLWRGSWSAALLSGIALGMSMLPEEFPLVLTVFMVMGAWRISRARVLTRRVAAIETLGAATVLCTDKTGTLTENRMTIAELARGAECWSANGGPLPPLFRPLLEAATLASRPIPFDPMDKAVHALAQTAGSPAAGDGRDLAWEYGLVPELAAVTQVWRARADGRLTAAAKGSPEAIAQLCRLAFPKQATLRRIVDDMARRGLRVLAVARADAAACAERPASPRAFEFRWLGLVGFADPLRATVPAAVRECRAAGIRVVMITGDYPQTATAIAAEAGLEMRGIITGDELAQMTDAELQRRSGDVTVFARILPEQKLRIVEALKRSGDIVAMTGDGVNDAPSLKAAHIGIAMGGRGTDVAREAASLVLLDDDFGSIVGAIRLGRRIYDNLRKAMAYILAVHVPIAGLAILPLLFGLPLVFSPLHIAFLELVIDPVCSIVFEAEGADADTMSRPPRDPREPLVSMRFVCWGLLQGALVLALVAAVYLLALRRGMPEADVRALTFTSLVATNAGLILVNRAATGSLWGGLQRPNPALWWILGAVSTLLAAILLVPATRRLFAFGPLHIDDLAVALTAGIGALVLLDALKRLILRPPPPLPAAAAGG